jgi:hypothetical protein
VRRVGEQQQAPSALQHQKTNLSLSQNEFLQRDVDEEQRQQKLLSLVRLDVEAVEAMFPMSGDNVVLPPNVVLHGTGERVREPHDHFLLRRLRFPQTLETFYRKSRLRFIQYVVHNPWTVVKECLHMAHGPSEVCPFGMRQQHYERYNQWKAKQQLEEEQQPPTTNDMNINNKTTATMVSMATADSDYAVVDDEFLLHEPCHPLVFDHFQCAACALRERMGDHVRVCVDDDRSEDVIFATREDAKVVTVPIAVMRYLFCSLLEAAGMQHLLRNQFLAVQMCCGRFVQILSKQQQQHYATTNEEQQNNDAAVADDHANNVANFIDDGITTMMPGPSDDPNKVMMYIPSSRNNSDDQDVLEEVPRPHRDIPEAADVLLAAAGENNGNNMDNTYEEPPPDILPYVTDVNAVLDQIRSFEVDGVEIRIRLGFVDIVDNVFRSKTTRVVIDPLKLMDCEVDFVLAADNIVTVRTLQTLSPPPQTSRSFTVEDVRQCPTAFPIDLITRASLAFTVAVRVPVFYQLLVSPKATDLLGNQQFWRSAFKHPKYVAEYAKRELLMSMSHSSSLRDILYRLLVIDQDEE